MALSGQNVVDLVEALSWPLLVLVLVLYLGPPLREAIRRLRELSFKAGPGGIEASGKAEAAVLVAAAVGKGQHAVAQPGEAPIAELSEKVHETIDVAFDERGASRVAGQRILWVDDKPQNNAYERKALEAMGLRIDLADSTEAALDRLRRRDYDLVISDMKRGGDVQAGLKLLAAASQEAPGLPVVVYSLSTALHEQALAHGAKGATASTDELFDLVLRNLGIEPPARMRRVHGKKLGYRAR